MIVYNYDADLEVSDTCVRSSLLSCWVELSINSTFQCSHYPVTASRFNCNLRSGQCWRFSTREFHIIHVARHSQISNTNTTTANIYDIIRPVRALQIIFESDNKYTGQRTILFAYAIATHSDNTPTGCCFRTRLELELYYRIFLPRARHDPFALKKSSARPFYPSLRQSLAHPTNSLDRYQ